MMMTGVASLSSTAAAADTGVNDTASGWGCRQMSATCTRHR